MSSLLLRSRRVEGRGVRVRVHNDGISSTITYWVLSGHVTVYGNPGNGHKPSLFVDTGPVFDLGNGTVDYSEPLVRGWGWLGVLSFFILLLLL